MFALHDGPQPCGCPGHGSAYRSLDEMAYDCAVLTLRRLGYLPRSGGVQKAVFDTGEVLFQEMELAAALSLAEEALELLPEMEAIIGPHLREAMRADDVYDAIERANTQWRKISFGKGTADKWEEAITLAMATGISAANDAVFVPEQFRRSMIDGMTRAGKYYTNEFFNTQVLPSLHTAVEKVLYGDETGARASYRIVQETLRTRLKSVPYWNLVANAAASRSYHYGMLRGGQMAGRTLYRFDAIMDNRTSDICTRMNGHTWTIDHGLSLMERVANAEHPDDVKDITPWVRYEDIKNLDTKALMDMGVAVPPLHGNCRSTIVLL